MSTIQEIKEAIGQLSPEERAELEAWLHPRIDHEWDSDVKEVGAVGPSASTAGGAD